MLPKPLAVTIVLCLCAPAYAYVLRSPSPRSHVAAYTPRFGLSTAAIDTAAVQTEDSLDNSVDNTENRADLTVAKTNMPALAKAAAVRPPGLATTGAIAVAANRIASRTALLPLLWAALIGMGVSGLGVWPKHAPRQGITFAKARLLRAGIILYGVKLTVQQIAGIGTAGLLLELFTISTVMPLGIFLGRALSVAPPLASLISVGGAICGCSAVAAAAPVVDGEAHEVAAAVGTVVLTGTCAMFLYPLFFKAVPLLAADPRLMGLYTGASVHELAGVVAAGNAMGAEVGATAIVTKLVRVCMLAPVLLVMSAIPSLRTRPTDDGDGGGD